MRSIGYSDARFFLYVRIRLAKRSISWKQRQLLFKRQQAWNLGLRPGVEYIKD